MIILSVSVIDVCVVCFVCFYFIPVVLYFFFCFVFVFVQFCCFVARLVTAGSNFWLALNSSLGKKTEVSCLSRLSRCVSERSHKVRSERSSVERAINTSVHQFIDSSIHYTVSHCRYMKLID